MNVNGMLKAIAVTGAISVFAFAGPAEAVCKKKKVGYFRLMAAGAPATANLGEAVRQLNFSLTGQPGDVRRGRQASMNRKKGNCLACHRMSDLKDQLFHGEVGPNLDGIGRKYTAGQLRQFIVDSRVFNPRTLMPAFFVKTGLTNVKAEFRGKTILTAQEVEDIVAYLQTLK